MQASDDDTSSDFSIGCLGLEFGTSISGSERAIRITTWGECGERISSITLAASALDGLIGCLVGWREIFQLVDGPDSPTRVRALAERLVVDEKKPEGQSSGFNH
jgi:hypothetical protein